MLSEKEVRLPRAAAQILLIPNEKIYPNPNQPRRAFDQSELVNLAMSIRVNGILQPLTVRETARGYELISGERRLRASRIAGMACVPCIIVEASDMKSAVFSLIENLQRQNLSFFEEAQAIDRLIDDYGVSREEAARLLGKAPSTVANKLRLLKLPHDIQKRIAEAGLTERHARAVLRLDNEKLYTAVEKIIDGSLNVSQSEALVEEMLSREEKPRRQTVRLFSDVRIFVKTVSRAVALMQEAGISASCKRRDTQEAYIYEVVIPKNAE